MAWKKVNRKGFEPRACHANYRWYSSTNQGQLKLTAEGIRYILRKSTTGEYIFRLESWVDLYEDDGFKKIAIHNPASERGQWKIVSVAIRKRGKAIKYAGAIYGTELRKLLGTKPRFWTITSIGSPYDLCLEEVKPETIRMLKGGKKFRLHE